MASHTLPALVRRINRKLEIGRGMHFTNADLALLVETGAYGALSKALIKETESKCREKQESEPGKPVKVAPLPMPPKPSMNARH